MEEMTESELIAVLIDKYTDLQRIKKANGEVGNSELEYQSKITTKKLARLNAHIDTRNTQSSCKLIFPILSIPGHLVRYLNSTGLNIPPPVG